MPLKTLLGFGVIFNPSRARIVLGGGAGGPRLGKRQTYDDDGELGRMSKWLANLTHMWCRRPSQSTSLDTPPTRCGRMQGDTSETPRSRCAAPDEASCTMNCGFCCCRLHPN